RDGRVPPAESDEHPPCECRQLDESTHVLGRQQSRGVDYQGRAAGLKTAGTWYVRTAFSCLSETSTAWFFTSRTTPRGSNRVPLGPPITCRGGAFPESATLQTPT